MGRAGLINSGGASGENDFAEAVKTAVINKRAGGMGLISGRKAFQRPMAEGVEAPQRHPGRLPLQGGHDRVSRRREARRKREAPGDRGRLVPSAAARRRPRRQDSGPPSSRHAFLPGPCPRHPPDHPDPRRAGSSPHASAVSRTHALPGVDLVERAVGRRRQVRHDDVRAAEEAPLAARTTGRASRGPSSTGCSRRGGRGARGRRPSSSSPRRPGPAHPRGRTGSGPEPSGVEGCGMNGPTPIMSRSSSRKRRTSVARLSKVWPGIPTRTPLPTS